MRPNFNKKTLVIILVSMLILIPSIIGVLYFVNQKINLIEYEENTTVIIDTTKEFIEAKKDKVDFAEIDDATGNDFQEILKNWALNGGDKLKSEDVINILLIGSDASANESYRANSAENGNTDVMMIVSIDTKKETIKLVSIMRDSYTYMSQFDRYAKLNAACANGGPSYLVETIENNYKIELDGYVMVDFISFVEVIDVLGGVNVDVPAYVANSLNKDILIGNPMQSGESVLLDGEQALAFSRVRKTDSDGDVSRVARQRQVITALIEKAKKASLTEINAVTDVIFKNVKTNIDKKTILSYAKMALSDNWTSFDISELTLPTEDTRKPYNSRTTAWVWIVDYPLAAQKLQLELYGHTNIKLEEERQTAITILNEYLS